MRWIGSRGRGTRLLAARLGLGALTALGAFGITAIPAQATITGDGACTGTGYSTPGAAGKPADVNAAKAASASGGTTVDFKSQSDWFVPSYKDYLAGHGDSPTGSMGSGFANVVFFGIHFPVAGGNGHGVSGEGGPISPAHLLPGPLDGHPLAAVLVGYGAATPDGNPPSGQKAAAGPCSGYILVHFQDVSAAGSLIGQVALFFMLIGALGVIGVALRRAG
jgi:hypothetical protein